ncbi:MAG TPA: nucleotidyltransferase family protein [Longimicrobiales bacterium]|nr:nucleotidyltransferase family protein [Longimicrobiales bacterium]
MRAAGVVLAAGLSRRMGGRDKVLVEVDGKPMVRRVVETALRAGLDPVIVVVRRAGSGVRRALEGLPVLYARNDSPEAGLSSSLREGLRSLGAESQAAVVLLGDMPWVRPADVAALVAAFDPAAGREICVPVYAGRRGNPVLWSARFFREMAGLEGDVGARALLSRHARSVHEVPAGGEGVLRDVDTPEALLGASAGGGEHV